MQKSDYITPPIENLLNIQNLVCGSEDKSAIIRKKMDYLDSIFQNNLLWDYEYNLDFLYQSDKVDIYCNLISLERLNKKYPDLSLSDLISKVEETHGRVFNEAEYELPRSEQYNVSQVSKGYMRNFDGFQIVDDRGKRSPRPCRRNKRVDTAETIEDDKKYHPRG